MTTQYTCIIVDDEPAARDILFQYLSEIDTIEVVTSCKNAVEAFTVLNTQKVDLVFLDISMPEITGLTLAKSIPENTKVIFTTAHREYAVEGFELKAIDYLLKPIAFDRFLQAIQTFMGIQKKQLEKTHTTLELHQDHFMFVRSDRKMVKVNFDAIIYIESLSDYIKIYTNEKTIITRETISNVETKLPSKYFLRVHRSYIVAISAIDSFTNEYIEIGKNAIPISRSYRKFVLDRLE